MIDWLKRLGRPKMAGPDEVIPVGVQAQPGEVSIDMIARPLVLGNRQDPVGYAKFRLAQIEKHIEHHGDNLPQRFLDEARTETYSLLHALRVHGTITAEEEWAHLMRVFRQVPGG